MGLVFLSFTITLLGLVVILNTRLKFFALDNPNHRSLHIKVTPRTGGLALMLGIMTSWYLLEVDYKLLLCVLALITISLVDDIYGLKVYWRFLVQLLACGFFLIFNGAFVGWWFIPLLLLAMLWMTNLYNFMDGSDGLAGGMAFIGFTAYGLAAYQSVDYIFSIMCACISVSSLAFLLFNFYPAKIFMGDAGSVPLGFLAAAIGLIGWEKHIWSLWYPILVFSPFIVDTTVTLIKRLLRREKVWQAHCEHYYQRLVQGGWGHQKTALAEYLIMVMVAVSALLIRNNQSYLMLSSVLLTWLILYGLILCYVDNKFKLGQSGVVS